MNYFLKIINISQFNKSIFVEVILSKKVYKFIKFNCLKLCKKKCVSFMCNFSKWTPGEEYSITSFNKQGTIVQVDVRVKYLMNDLWFAYLMVKYMVNVEMHCSGLTAIRQREFFYTWHYSNTYIFSNVDHLNYVTIV